MWARVGSGLPEHARRTKATAERRSALRYLRLVGNWFVVLPRAHGTGEVAIAAFDGGTVVLDRSRGVVRRRYGTGPVSDEYLAWRRVFSTHVGAPSFDVSADRQVLIEDLVVGRHLLDVDLSTRVSCLRSLLLGYVSLTRVEGRKGPRDVGSELRELLAKAELPTSFSDIYAQNQTGWFARSVAWVPSAYEATAKNLMVRNDGSPAPIDLGDLGLDPCFVYPIGIITVAGADLLDSFLAGSLDEPLEELLEAAGSKFRRDPSSRLGLLLDRLIYAALRDSRDSLGVDVSAFERSVARRWRELSSELAMCASARQELGVGEEAKPDPQDNRTRRESGCER